MWQNTGSEVLTPRILRALDVAARARRTLSQGERYPIRFASIWRDAPRCSAGAGGRYP